MSFYVLAYHYHHVQVLSLFRYMAAESIPMFLLGCLSLPFVQVQDVVFAIRDSYTNLVVRQASIFLAVIPNIYILFTDFVVGFAKSYTAIQYTAVLVISSKAKILRIQYFKV